MPEPKPGQNPVHIKQDILWGDMDAFGHINNTVYFRYFEDIRMEYFKKAGVMNYMQEHNVGPILANTQSQFRLPLAYPDNITISTCVKELQGKRFTMEYQVYSNNHNQIAAEGNGLIIFYDYNLKKSCAVPDEIKKTIAALEHN